MHALKLLSSQILRKVLPCSQRRNRTLPVAGSVPLRCNGEASGGGWNNTADEGLGFRV